MAKTAIIETNWTGGELSPFLNARVDIAKYQSGAKVMQDFHPVVQGGALTRDGTMQLGLAKGRSRLIPFVFDRANAWQIEVGTSVGAGYLRIWRADRSPVMDGIVPLELVTPFSDLIISEMTYEQADDTMFFFHPSIPTRRLVRRSATRWTFDTLPFVTQPFGENGYTPTGISLTLSDPTVGTGRTATAGAALFLDGDVGRDIFDATGGRATITAVADSTHATVSVTSAFDAALVTGYTLSDSPLAFLAADRKQPVGGAAVLYGALGRNATITLDALTGSITIDSDNGIFDPTDTGKRLFADTGVASLVYVSATQCTADVTVGHDFLALSYGPGEFGISAGVFRAADVGRFVTVNDGLFKITAFTDATTVTAEILVSPSALVAAPPGSWTLGGDEFSSTRGYPACGTLGEQRLWLAGTLAQPTEIFASRIGLYYDFAPGLGDADGFSYSLNMHQRNPIRHLVFTKRLFALTAGNEASLRGGNEKAIGATNIQKEDGGRYGANFVRPAVVASEILFVQGAGRKVRAMGFDSAEDAYVSPDRTVFAEHITESGIVDMAFQSEPYSLLHCVRVDGVMAVAAYDVAQEVIAWSRFTTAGGFYRSVSVIPRPDRDDVWTIVDRPTEDGASRYFVEVFDPRVATDCATYTNAPADSHVPTDHLDGFDRFEGQELSVRADDAYMGMIEVISGRITLPRPALLYIEAGLPFVPTLEMLPPELGGGGSTAQGSNVSVHEVVVRVLDTRTLEINGVVTDFRRFGPDLLDQPPPEFTGDQRQTVLTDDLYKPRLVIRQPLPFPAHVQAVIRKVTFNDT